jgi:hypothetical protein
MRHLSFFWKDRVTSFGTFMFLKIDDLWPKFDVWSPASFRLGVAAGIFGRGVGILIFPRK